MLSSLNPVAKLLWLALGGFVALSVLNGMAPVWLASCGIVCLCLAYWLVAHRVELSGKYAVAEQQAAIPGPYDKMVWRTKPFLRDMAPGLVILGFAGFYFAYQASHDGSPQRIAKLIYLLFGMPGVVVFWSLLGSLALGKGVETMVGAYAKRGA